MQVTEPSKELRVAVLVDCDNTSPEIVEYALLEVAKFGRVVLRRGYGNTNTLGNRWQEALVRLAFTPHLQFQYAAGKNTADIALALDALEAMFDQRADFFCLVTSDSDFSYLCRKLRERGAEVAIVGEVKTPPALRNAPNHFFEWRAAESSSTSPEKASPARKSSKPAAGKRPKSVISAVALMTEDAPEGRIGIGALGQYLKRSDPAFSPKALGHSGLLAMVQAYPELQATKEGGGYVVELKRKVS